MIVGFILLATIGLIAFIITVKLNLDYYDSNDDEQ